MTIIPNANTRNQCHYGHILVSVIDNKFLIACQLRGVECVYYRYTCFSTCLRFANLKVWKIHFRSLQNSVRFPISLKPNIEEAKIERRNTCRFFKIILHKAVLPAHGAKSTGTERARALTCCCCLLPIVVSWAPAINRTRDQKKILLISNCVKMTYLFPTWKHTRDTDSTQTQNAMADGNTHNAVQ